MIDRADLRRRFRHTGATWPGDDPRPTHGAEMEGWFWRVTDPDAGRVLVVLCGVNRSAQGDWATVAVAAHPEGIVRSGALRCAAANDDRFCVRAWDGGLFDADERHVHLEVDDVIVDLRVDRPVGWPHATGAGGVFSVLPFLGQYWHPHVLDATAHGTLRIDGDEQTVHGQVYAEKNWGAGFPQRWWWGQAHGFARRDVCVAFCGGVLTAGPLHHVVGGAVVRIGRDVLRFAPPLSVVHTSAGGGTWELRARRPRASLHLVGTATGTPFLLPVPVPGERTNADTDVQYPAGELRVVLDGAVSFRGTSALAALETGTRP